MSRPLPRAVRLRLALYRALFPLALLAMLPGLLRRMRKRGGYRADFAQRFGHFTPEVIARLRQHPRVWLQSISVGETVLALKLAQQLRRLEPELGVVISVQTSTGYTLAKQTANEWVEVIYNPLDLAGCTRRAVAAIQPRRFVIIEGVWPQLLAQCYAFGASTALIARLSPRAARRFQKFRGFTGPFFRLLDPICVAEPEDVARWEALGAEPAQIAVTGNLKYDEPPPDAARVAELGAFLRTLGVPAHAPVLLGGSTFPGEEKILAEAFLVLRRTFPDLFLILVPRHIERTREVLEELRPLGLQLARRTEPPQPGAEALLIDTNGELRTWYQLATIVFIGKSLTATGGQNPVEAALAGKPVLFGPHMENFRPIVAQWLAQDAAVQVANAAELTTRLGALLGDPAARAALAGRAQRALQAHQGAAERSARRILQRPLSF